eukprot:gene25545-31220_t
MLRVLRVYRQQRLLKTRRLDKAHALLWIRLGTTALRAWQLRTRLLFDERARKEANLTAAVAYLGGKLWLRAFRVWRAYTRQSKLWQAKDHKARAYY